MNPFKFGTIVEGDYFTDRNKELQDIIDMLDSENHLVLISPRRYGKSSLINKALQQMKRPYILIDMMQVISVESLAATIVRQILKQYTMERIKHLISNLRVTPTLTYKAQTDSWSVSFTANTVQDSMTALEDAMDMLERVTTPNNRLIIVFDEFQEVTEVSKTLDRQLRAIMQRQKGLNYVFMGSQESMMEEIFEKKKSPFYHFGQRMVLHRLPYEELMQYIEERMPIGDKTECETVSNQILKVTNLHPYYTQQLASMVYRKIKAGSAIGHIVEDAVSSIIEEHDLDYERLWQTMTRGERRVIQQLAQGINPTQNRTIPYTTTASTLKKLIKNGYIVKTTQYELEDPFFKQWILQKIQGGPLD